jgi:hypothetical protein
MIAPGSLKNVEGFIFVGTAEKSGSNQGCQIFLVTTYQNGKKYNK